MTKYFRKSASSLVTAAALLATTAGAQYAMADTNRLCAAGNTSDCYLTGNFPPDVIAAAGLLPGDDGALTVRFIDGEWSMNGVVIGNFGGPGWTPVVGNWQEDEPVTDEYDNIGVYRNGLWIFKNSWNFVDPGYDITRYVYGDASWSPIPGKWKDDGTGQDNIGLYKDGVFKIRLDSDDPASEEIITFEIDIDPNFGTAALPISGNFKGVNTDKVGMLNGSAAIYANYNVTGSYDLYVGDDLLVSRGIIGLKTSLTRFPIVLPAPDSRIVYSRPPSSSPPQQCPEPTQNGCKWINTIVIGNPQESDQTEIPTPQPW